MYSLPPPASEIECYWWSAAARWLSVGDIPDDRYYHTASYYLIQIILGIVKYFSVIICCRRLPARDGGYSIVRTISGCGRPAHWPHHHGEVTVGRSPVPRPRGRWRMSNIFVGDAKYFLGRGRGRRRGREWDWSDVCGANQKRHGQRRQGGCSGVSGQQSSGI